jgi:hypothetical protein
MSLVVLTNIPTPFRTALFDALAEAAAGAGKRFHVLYCAKTEPDRHWSYDASKMLHAHTELRGFHRSLTGIHAHLNPGVLAELNRLKPDSLIIVGSWNTPTMLVAGLNIYSPAPRRFYWPDQASCAVQPIGGLIGLLRRRVLKSYDGFITTQDESPGFESELTDGGKAVIRLARSADVMVSARTLVSQLYPR